MGSHYSPFRYPGGKSKLSDFLSEVIKKNKLEGCTYVEPFAGGAGAALNLLFSKKVDNIVLNDADNAIYKCWKAMLNDTDNFIKLLNKTRVSLAGWHRQRKILTDRACYKNATDLEIGFAVFYLNRCNRSGILKSGPIGGLNQEGDYKINARYTKATLVKRIKKIAENKSKIKFYNYDAATFLKKRFTDYSDEKQLVYLDPPYFVNGKKLYRRFFELEDHKKLAKLLNEEAVVKWIVSYDDAPEIHAMYKGKNKNVLHLNYFLNQVKLGRELLIASHGCKLPEPDYMCSVEKKKTYQAL